MSQVVKYSLRELRARHNVSQAVVAKHMGVARETYLYWEKDLSNVGIAKVYKLADYFDVNINEIKLK